MSNIRPSLTRETAPDIGYLEVDAYHIDVGMPLPDADIKITTHEHPDEVLYELKSDISGKTIRRSTIDETGCFGAAILAGVATGMYNCFEDAAAATVAVKQRYRPNPLNGEIYNKNYKTYREIYRRLKS